MMRVIVAMIAKVYGGGISMQKLANVNSLCIMDVMMVMIIDFIGNYRVSIHHIYILYFSIYECRTVCGERLSPRIGIILSN